MTDIEGKELKVGDTVVYKSRWSANSLSIGKIVRFTPKSARVETLATKESKLCGGSEIYKIEKCQ